MIHLIDPGDLRFELGYEAIDYTHKEFIALVNKIGKAPGEDFADLFIQLAIHTEAHFAAEERLMEQSGFPAIREHLSEHQRVLGELHRFGQRVQAGSIVMGRAYITEQVPQWFRLHTSTMDSALAAHLNNQ